MEKVLLLGGPGNISKSSIIELLAKGYYEVAVFTLPESDMLGLDDKVKFYRGNRDNEDELEKVISDFDPGIVIDYVCFRPEQAEAAAKLLCGKIEQYIFLSTVDVYGYPLSRLPMREYDEKRPTNCEYAQGKLECELILKQYEETHMLPLTIIRPVYSFGPGFVLDFFSKSGGRNMVPRIRADRPILVPGGGNTLMHVSSAYNTGRMIAQFAGHAASIGKVYNCGHPSPLTHDEYIRLFSGVLGKEARLVHVPFENLLESDSSQMQEILPILTRFNLFFSIDAFREEFPDFEWDFSLEDGVREYINYNDSINGFTDAERDNFQDRIIKDWLACTEEFRI